MPFVRCLGQRIGNAGANPDHRGLLDAEFHRDRVSGLEADAADITREPIRVLRHNLHGVSAIGLIDAHRPRRADAIAVKKDHDFANDLLFGPGRGDTAGSYGPDACYLAQALGLRLNRVENFLAESAHQLLGVDRSDASDHAGAEVFLDAVE